MNRFLIAFAAGGLLLSANASGAVAQTMMMQSHHESMARMHELLREAQETGDAEERRRLMAEHFELMRSRMDVMSGGGTGGGMMMGRHDCRQRMDMMQDLMIQMMAREEMMQDGALEEDGEPE